MISFRIASDAREVETVELSLLVRHRPNGWLVLKEALELHRDIERPGTISILMEFASLILADAQTPNRVAHFCLDLLPWATWGETFATGLAGKMLVFKVFYCHDYKNLLICKYKGNIHCYMYFHRTIYYGECKMHLCSCRYTHCHF
jgi:hypothetical protein